MLDYAKRHPVYSRSIAWMLGYRPGSLRSLESMTAWLVDRFGMLAIVRVSISG